MPRGDGTGPDGKGPKKADKGFPTPQRKRDGSGTGRGQGDRKGQGQGRGMGRNIKKK